MKNLSEPDVASTSSRRNLVQFIHAALITFEEQGAWSAYTPESFALGSIPHSILMQCNLKSTAPRRLPFTFRCRYGITDIRLLSYFSDYHFIIHCIRKLTTQFIVWCLKYFSSSPSLLFWLWLASTSQQSAFDWPVRPHLALACSYGCPPFVALSTVYPTCP